MICNASERNRVLTRWLSASAVRFIGSQRFSITIENEVSTSSATTAWVRVSVSEISTSSTVTSMRVGPSPSSPVPACRSTALVRVRVTFHGSVSPNCPRPGGAGQLAGGPGPAGVTLAVPTRKLLRHIA